MRLEVYVGPPGYVRFQTPYGDIVTMSAGDAMQLATDLEHACIETTRRDDHADPGQAGSLDAYRGLRAALLKEGRA